MPLILRQVKGSKLTIPEMDGNLVYLENLANAGGSAIQVTYTELTDAISSSELIPGAYYIITDFKTCYDRPDFDQFRNPIAVSEDSYIEGPVEPIIVLATSVSTLAPDAYQPIYPNDKIKYDVTYNTTESNNPAFGRISERIDEFDNRTDYDHNTIQFKRYRLYYFSRETPQAGTIQLLNDGTANGTNTLFTNYTVGQVIAYPNSVEGFFKIESIDSDTLMTVSGLSINSFGGSGEFYIADSGSYDSYYRSNVDPAEDFSLYSTFPNDTNLNNYIGDYSRYYLEGVLGDFLLANNVFKDGAYRNNIFGNVCYNNTFNDDCSNNTIGNHFRNNITDDDFDGNVIGNFFANNLITANFQYNKIGEEFENNFIINDDFQSNQIGNNFTNNWLDSYQGFEFDRNQIGEDFISNTIFRNFDDNTIGKGFNSNNVYQTFYDNNISNDFTSNTIGDSEDIGTGNFEDNVIGNNFNGNSTLGIFEKNQIGNDFVGNQLADYFYSNVIGNNFFSNDLSYSFAYNQIANSFSNNVIANDFGFGGGNSRGNVIGNNFQGNNIGEYFYDNNVKDYFSSNNIGDSFVNNNVSFNFDSNNIGYNFQNNDIKVSVIGTDFGSEQGQLSTVINVNSPNGVDNTYPNVSQFSTSGIGENSTFDIDVSGGVVNTVTINNVGYGYVNGDTILINGSQFGGVDGIDDLTLQVDSATTTTYVTDPTSCTIVTDVNGNAILYYFDAMALLPLNVVPPTSQS
jgi:hypothetical protein